MLLNVKDLNFKYSLTEGSIWKAMLLFALPVFLGNVFQQLYNAFDTWCVGYFINDDALAAVSSSGSLIFMMVSFFNGVAMGAGVIIARSFGARQYDAMGRTIHTAIAFGLVTGAVLTVAGVTLTPTILRWMGTPAEVLPQSIEYFRYYFLGAIFTVMYNIFVGILHAVGDSKHPLYYLIFASNDIQSNAEIGGLEIAVSDSPAGPFKGYLGKSLLGDIYHNAQPIDAHLFEDDDGTVYLYYGGWGHMMVCRMNETMDGFLPMEEPAYDGIARELTPDNYVEAPYVMKIDGKYHLMYSSGHWTDGTYCVKAGVSDDPCSKFEYYGDVLRASELADGPGHNSAFCFGDKWYVAYHRRTVGDLNPHHRKLCIDLLPIRDGRLQSVDMT